MSGNAPKTLKKSFISEELDILKTPVCCLVIGMAGSGKTTLMQRIKSYSCQNNTPAFMVNLDPGVRSVPYKRNVDIRDSVDYKKVMSHYKLGPNGAILTSLNLFASKFDSVLKILSNRSDEFKFAFFDTPGQVEVFSWSASGAIITESLSASFPTVVLYVVDADTARSPVTFMTNMVHACSVLYKSNLPFMLVFNKIDLNGYQNAVEWIGDSDKFEEELSKHETYMATLTSSINLSLQSFFRNIKIAGVSALTGEGIPQLFAKIKECRNEYKTDFLPFLRDKVERNKK